MADEYPAWFRRTVSTGLQSFVSLGLPYQPPTEVIKLTGEVWIKALWAAPIDWTEAQDRLRLEAAFVSLLPILERWPVPLQVLAALPRRPELLKLDAPPPTPEQQAQHREGLRKVKAALSRVIKRIPKEGGHNETTCAV